MSRQLVVAAALRLHRHSPRLGKQLQRETRSRRRFYRALAQLNSRRGLRGLLADPVGAAVDQPMLVVLRSHDDRALIVEQLRDRLFGGARGGKPAIEDVTLTLDFTGDRFHPDRDADDSVGESDSLQVRAYEPHPRLVARRRPRRPHEVLEGLAIREREAHRHLALALPARLELRRDVSDERVDDEYE